MTSTMEKFMYRARRKLELETRRLTAPLRHHPTMVIIGAQKAGTTSLYDYLQQHPHVGDSFKKEVSFFNDHYHKGLSWYRGHFPFTTDTFDVVFEASPNYIFSQDAPTRVAKHYPNMKIIALLRHPIHRAYSHYKMDLRFGRIDKTLTFADVVDLEHNNAGYDAGKSFSYLARGRYWEQLARWFDRFPKEQILVRQAEELFENTAGVYQEVLQFLELSDWQPSNFEARNQSGASQNVRDNIGNELYNILMDEFAPHNEQLFQNLGTRYNWD